MEWYYAIEKQQMGPVSDSEFGDLVRKGTITSNTLVWNRTMTDWAPYGQVAGKPQDTRAGNTKAGGPRLLHCSECGRAFPENEMINYNNVWVCAACKPVFIQKIKEGVELGITMDYAGFWIRVVAAIIDGLALSVIEMIIIAPLQILTAFMVPDMEAGGESGILSTFLFLGIALLIWLIQLGTAVAYETWFVGKYAATPGKMVFGLKIVNADGSRVSYLKAFGRYFAKMLSYFVLLIGVIMVAFDSEKRGLHDHICNTRVIRK